MKSALQLALSVTFALNAAVIAAPTLVVFGWTMSTPVAQVGDSVGQLRDLGKKLATAVLNHDIETILIHDQPNSRAEDRLALQDRSSDLYCYLFDSRCTTAKVSVHEILSGARRLDINVKVLTAKGQPTHGWLLFFDGTKIPASQLSSPSFLCEHVGQIASWMFKRERGQWLAATPPFDAETDTLCSPR
jgi:hypothetical protein